MFWSRGPWLGQVPLVQRPTWRPFLSGNGFWLAGPVPALTDATFKQALSAPAAVVDFWSPSCPICVQYKPVFEDAASQAGNVLMAEANVDEAGQTAGSYNIQSIPTTIFFVNGKEVNRVEGGMTKQDLLAELSRLSGGAAPSKGAPVPTPGPAPMLGPGPTPAPLPVPGSSSTLVAVGSIAAVALLTVLFVG